VAGILFVAAAVILVVTEAVAASAFPGYSYVDNYVSDLGVPDVGQFEGRAIDSPVAWVMNAGFVLQGLLMLGGMIAAFRAIGKGRARWVLVVLAAIFAAGFILISTVHGSEQAEQNGTVMFHFLGGGLLALAGNAILIVSGIAAGRFGAPLWQRAVSIALGLFGIAALVLLTVDKGNTSISVLGEGALERGALYAIVLWELLAGAVLIRASRAEKASSAY
jgi:hypothetical membrane protein